MEITSFQNNILCGELTDFFITISGGLDLASTLVVKLRNQRSGTVTDIICELIDDKYRVTYVLPTPGHYKISILINGNLIESRDVKGEQNDHYKESMAQTELLMMSRIDETYERLERDRQAFLNSCAYECALKVKIKRMLRELSTMKIRIEELEREKSALERLKSKLEMQRPNAGGVRR